MLDSCSPLYPLYAMQLMIRDNKSYLRTTSRKGRILTTVIIVIVKPNSPANRINASTPSKAAAKSTRRIENTEKPKPKPQPHYTRQADPENSNRKQKNQRR